MSGNSGMAKESKTCKTSLSVASTIYYLKWTSVIYKHGITKDDCVYAFILWELNIIEMCIDFDISHRSLSLHNSAAFNTSQRQVKYKAHTMMGNTLGRGSFSHMVMFTFIRYIQS